jgi:hypothetical protein
MKNLWEYAWNNRRLFNALFVRSHRIVVENLKVRFRRGFDLDTLVYVYLYT